MRSGYVYTALALLWSQQHGAAALRFQQGFSVQEINEDEPAPLDVIQVLNDDDLSPDQPMDLLVRCQHGSLSIASTTRQSLSETSFMSEEEEASAPYRTIRLQSTFYEVQMILQALEYSPDPDYHGSWGSRGSVLRCRTTLGNEVISAWLEISKHGATETCAFSEDETCSSQSDSASFPSTAASFHERRLSVKAVNDAPTITLLSTEPLKVDNGSCVALSAMVFDDVDELAMQGLSEMPMITAELKATNGSLQLNQRTALDHQVRIRDQPMNSRQPVLVFANASVVLDGSLSDLNDFLATIQYCAFAGQNISATKPIMARNDVVAVKLSDNGICGEDDSTPLSSMAALPIEIVPVIDLGQISASVDPVTLANHSVVLNLQYEFGNVDQLDVNLQFDHNVGTMIGIDGQFAPLIVDPVGTTTAYVQTITCSDFAGEDARESEVLHLTTAFRKEIQLLEARLDADQTFDEAAVELSFTFAGVTSSFAIDLLPSASSASNLQIAMNSLTNAGRVTVTGGVWTGSNQVSWRITFESLASSSIPLLAVNVLSFPGVWSGAGDQVRVTRLQAGSIAPQIDEITISADNTLTSGEFALRIVNPPELRAVVSKIPFDVTAADLEDLLTSKTGLDQVSITEAVNAAGQLTWQITFLTDTFIAQYRKISVLPAWYNAQRPFGPQHCAACVAFSSPSASVDQVQYKSVSQGSIGLDGSFRLKFDGLVNLDISVHDSQPLIVSKLTEALTYRIATQLSIIFYNCEDSQLECSWKVSYPPKFASAEAHFLINDGGIIGSGLEIDITNDATGFQEQIYLSSSHHSWAAPRSVSIPYQFTEDRLRDAISALTGLDITARCRALEQRVCIIEYNDILTTIPAVYLSDGNSIPAVEVSGLHVVPSSRPRDREESGLVIRTTDNSKALLPFKFSRSVCRLVGDCRSLQSQALSFESTNEMIIQAVNALAVDGEVMDQVNVLRFGSESYLHIVNLPASFVLNVKVFSQMSWQVLCTHFHLQGAADQVGLGLKNATLYTLGGPRRINRLSISLHSVQDEISELSTAVNVDVRANYEQINFTMPREIVLENEYVKWLSSVSVSDSSNRWIDPKYDCGGCRIPTSAFELSIEADHVQVRVNDLTSAVAMRVRSLGHALDLRGHAISDFNEAIKGVYIDANSLLRDPSKLSLYTKNQTFHVRAIERKTKSVQVLSASTSVTDGAIGTVQLSLTLPSGYYDILESRASHVSCNSGSIDVTSTMDSIANQIATMPCSPPFDASALYQREIQAIQVDALDPFSLSELIGSFKIEFNRQTTISIPIGSSSADLRSILLGIIADPAIDISSMVLNGEKSFMWLITFGETKDQHYQLNAIVPANGVPSYSVKTSVVKHGFGASDILLNRLIPELTVSVRELTAPESSTYGLEFSFLNVSREFPTFAVLDNSLASAATTTALDVKVYSVNHDKKADDSFQLRINQQTTALIDANASSSEVEQAIFSLGMKQLSLSIRRHALFDGDALFEWIIVASFPIALDIETVKPNRQDMGTIFYEVSCQDHGFQVLATFDTLRFSLSRQDTNTIVNGFVAVRVEKRIERGATIDFAFSYLTVRQNETVEFGDMILRGMERNLKLVISASQGLVSLIPRNTLESKKSLISTRVAQSALVLEGSTAELNDILQFQRLLYSTNPDAFGFDRAIFALDWRDGKSSKSIPIEIIAPVVAPSLQLPVDAIRVLQDEEIFLHGLKFIANTFGSATTQTRLLVPENQIVRVEIRALNGGMLALNQVMQKFFGYSDKQGQWKNILDLSGSIDQVNLALTGVRYNAPTLNEDGNLDWLQLSIYAMDNSTWSAPKQYRLNISISARPTEVQILIGGQIISDTVVLTIAEDSAMSLRNISIRLKGNSGSPSNQLNASLFAAQGAFYSSNSMTESKIPVDKDSTVYSMAGTVDDINKALHSLSYVATPNFHGTDRIVLKVAQNPEREIIDRLYPESTAVFPVFITPVYDSPRLLWASSRSNTTTLTVSTTAPVPFPALQIIEGEQESDGNFYIMKLLYRAVLEADSGTLVHDAVASQKTALKRSRLTFEGTLRDLNAMIVSTKYKASPAFGSYSEISANVSIQVILVDFPSTMVVGFNSVSSALLRIDVSGLQRLPLLKFLQYSMTTDEEKEVYLGDAFDWENHEAFTFQTHEFTLDISAMNGSLYQVVDDHRHSLPLRRTHRVAAEGLEQLKSILSRLYYVPDLDFNGHDKIQLIAANQSYALSVRVLPVNDAPHIQIKTSAISSSDDDKLLTKLFLPGLEVSDPDDEKRLQVELRTVNSSLVIDFVDQRWNGIQVLQNSESLLVLSASPQLLNSALNEPVLLLIPAAKSSTPVARPTLQPCLIEFCVSDGKVSSCETRSYTLSMPMLLFSKSSDRREVSRNHALNFSSLFNLNYGFIYDSDIVIRASVSTGYLTIEDFACADLQEVYGRSDQEPAMEMILAGSFGCLAAAFPLIAYHINPVSDKAVDAVALTAFDAEERLLGNDSIIIHVAARLSPFKLIVQQHERAVNSTEWQLTRSEHRRLSSFTPVTINATETGYEEEEQAYDETFMSLNVSCSTCLLSYPAKYVPGLSYQFAHPSSQTQMFSGSANALNEMLEQLEISANTSGLLGEHKVMIWLSFDPALSVNYRTWFSWNETVEIVIPYKLIPVPLSLDVSQTEFVASLNLNSPVMPLNAVKISGGEEDLDRMLHIYLDCAGGNGLVSIENSQLPRQTQVINKRCGPEQGRIKLTTSRKLVNLALASVAIKPNLTSALDKLILSYSVAWVDEEDSIQTVALTILSYPDKARSRITLNQSDIVLRINEDEFARIGVWLTLKPEVQDDENLLEVSTKVARGILFLPDAICCVSIEERERGFVIVGPPAALRNALWLLEYTGDENFAGDDEWTLSIKEYQVESNARSMDPYELTVPLVIVPVNDAPQIHHIRRSNPRKLAPESFSSETFQISDVDLVSLQAVGGNASKAKFQVNISVIFGSFLLHANALGRVHVLNASEGSTGYTSLSFEAIFEDVNFLLASVLYQPNESVSCSENLDNFHISVNDRAHGVGTWIEQETSLALQISGCNNRLRDPELVLPPESVCLDEEEMKLTIFGLQLIDEDLQFTSRAGQSLKEANEMVSVVGAGGFSIDMEVQRVYLMPPELYQTMTLTVSSTSGGSTLSGSFELQVDLPSAGVSQIETTSVYANAVAMAVDELLGDQHNGRGPSESIEAALLYLYGSLSPKPKFHILKSTSLTGNSWTIHIMDSPGSLAIPTICTSSAALSAQGISASIMLSAETPPLGGRFKLKLGEETTFPVNHDASAFELQNALESLSTVEIVRVTKPAVNTWEITYFSPGENVPLVEGIIDTILPQATKSDAALSVIIANSTSIKTERISHGKGQGNLYEVTVGAIRTDPVYQLSTSAVSRITGGFSLGFQDPDNILGSLLSVTNMIAFDAVAMRSDEGFSQNLGGRAGESVQTRLETAIRALPRRFLPRGSTNAVSVSVIRTAPNTMGGVSWNITIKNAPLGFPTLVVSNSALTGSQVQLTLRETQLPNPVGGTFTLSYGGKKTEPIAADADAQTMETLLNQLSSIQNKVFGYGRVAVRKSPVCGPRDLYSYAVLFVEDIATIDPSHQRLIADSSLLTGVGAFARVEALQERISSGSFSTMEFPMSGEDVDGWTAGVHAQFRGDWFRLQGFSDDLVYWLQYLSYQLPADWFGSVSVLIALSSALESDTSWSSKLFNPLSIVQSVPVPIPFRIPTVDIQVKEASPIQVDRARSIHLQFFNLRVVDFAATLWASARVTSESGFIYPKSGGFSVANLSASLWLNGTIASINSQLEETMYSGALEGPAFDRVTLAVFINGAQVGVNHITIRIQDPAIAPLLHIDGSLEGPFTSSHWEIVTRKLTHGDDLRIMGVSIDSSGGSKSRVGDILVLIVSAEFGSLSISPLDQLIVSRAASGTTLHVAGEMDLLNDALRVLHYKCSETYYGRDSITFLVRNNNSATIPPHKRTIQLQIAPLLEIPRVYLSSTTYQGQEDTTFRFSDMKLYFPSAKKTDSAISTSLSGSKTFMSQLWATELATLTTKYNYPRTALDDRRHRWVLDLPPMKNASWSRSFCASGNLFYFTGSDVQHGDELWVSDGSTLGTHMLIDLWPGSGSSSPSGMTLFNGFVYFAASGLDLSWMLGSSSCNSIRNSSVNSNILYAVAASNVWNPAKVYECPVGYHWAMTKEISSYFPPTGQSESANVNEPYVYWNTCQWSGYVFGGLSRKYFRLADSQVTGALKHAGRRDSAPVEVSFSTAEFAGIVCIRDQAFIETAGLDRELWRTDGTTSGTTRVLDLRVGHQSSNPRAFSSLQSQWLVFQATTDEFGTELFKTDGTAAGTSQIEDIWHGPRSSNPDGFVEWATGDGRMYFAATTDNGRELWATDGFSSFSWLERGRKATKTATSPAVGTVAISDICSGSQSSNPMFLAPTSSGIFFSADDCLHGRELWITDGTASGTRMVKDLATQAGVGSDPAYLVLYGTKVYFQAKADAAIGRELYVSDGTAAGTVLLVDLSPGSHGSSPSFLTVMTPRDSGGAIVSTDLYFYAFDANERGNLWKSDGTQSGTAPVLDDIFTQNPRRVLRARDYALGDSRSHLCAFKNAIYYPLDIVTDLASDQTSGQSAARYSVQVQVNVGHIGIARNNETNQSDVYSSTILLNDTYEGLTGMLNRLTYYPLPNWNSQLIVETPVVEWTFAIGLEGQDFAFETYADLLLAPTPDVPVINVPYFEEDPVHFTSDLLTRLRLRCLPITCYEDTVQDLSGFSIRTSDSPLEPDPFALLTVDLSVSHGSLLLDEVTSGCIARMLGSQTPAHKLFQADTSCVNSIFQSWKYLGDPNFSGQDRLQIAATSAENLTNLAVVPIIVTEMNDAPYFTSSLMYESDEDIPLVIQDIQVIDPDISSSASLVVTIDVASGSVALLHAQAITVTRGSAINDPQWTLVGHLHDINIALSSVVYTSAKDWNSLASTISTNDAFDAITLRVNDGNAANGSTISVVHVFVNPVPDPIVIAVAENIPTTEFADASLGFLHGDEDSWIDVYGLSFSSVDDTSRMSLQVTLQVPLGILEISRLAGISFVDADIDVSLSNTRTGSTLVFKGVFAHVNETMSSLRYRPNLNFYGSDQLLVMASAIDEYTLQETPEASALIAIQIDAVNDPPVWSNGLGSAEGLPVKGVSGITFHDVDIDTLDCSVVSCIMELIIETRNGFVVLPSLSEEMQTGSVEFATELTDLGSTYVVLSGMPSELNRVLSEMVFQLDKTEYHDSDDLKRENIEVSLTIDDRGTFGKGGPLVRSTRVLFTSVDWPTQPLIWNAPIDVLTLDEDTAYQFSGDLNIDNPDAPRAFPTILEVTIYCTNGTFGLSSTVGLQILQNDSSRIVFKGFLPDINAAFNGSSYIPSPDWFGSETISFNVKDLGSSSQSRSTETTVFLYVAPVCDSPKWLSSLPSSAKFTMEEDTRLLIDDLSLTTPDLDDEQHQVTLNITALHGGVMFATWRGLLIWETQYTNATPQMADPFQSHEDSLLGSRLFFSRISVTGSIQDMNAALRGMIYKAAADYNTNGHEMRELSLLAQASCTDGSLPLAYYNIRIAITAVNDPPTLLSPSFVQISTDESVLHSELQRSVENALQATEHTPLLLEDLSVEDVDRFAMHQALSLPMAVNISCIGCSITLSSPLADLKRQFGFVFVPASGDEVNTQFIVHGTVATLNTGLMDKLVFQSAKDTDGLSFVVIRLSDLGNFGAGGVLQTAFALTIAVDRAIDRPQIFIAPYGVREPVIRIDENSSILLTGAPLVAELPRNRLTIQRSKRVWSLMRAQPFGMDSGQRLNSLQDFDGSNSLTTGFYATLNGKLLFRGTNSGLGSELWESDGADAGTGVLKDLYPGPKGSDPSFLTPFSADGRVYFSASGLDLSWRIPVDHRDSCQSFRPSAFDTRVYYAVSQANIWDPEKTYDCPVGYRWMTTAEATGIFVGSIPTDGHESEPLVYFDQCGWSRYQWGGVDRMYFRFADSKTTGSYKHAGFRESYRLDTGFQTDVFAGIVCIRDASIEKKPWGPELWATDGISHGTKRVRRINSLPDGSKPAYFAEMNQLLFFQATSSDFGAELWASDGSQGGTYLVADMEPGTRSSEPRYTTALGSLLYFSASTETFGREPWVSDGLQRTDFTLDHSSIGTRVLLDVCAGTGSSNSQYFTALDVSALILFQANDCIHGAELWRTDGTSTGTYLLKDIRTGALGSMPSYLTQFSNRIYFQADDGIHGAELWVSDGSTVGTVMLMDLAAGAVGGQPSFLTVLTLGSTTSLIFSAQDERDQKSEFWQSDGTLAGTTKLFPNSREIVEINREAMDAMPQARFQVLTSPAQSFLYFGRKQIHEYKQAFQLQDQVTALSLRSITLDADVNASDTNAVLTLTLNCSEGSLSIGRSTCPFLTIDQGDAASRSAVLAMNGTLDALNCAMEKLTYHSNPQAKDVRDVIRITLVDNRLQNTMDYDDPMRFTATKSIPVDIRAVNNAPVIGMLTEYVVSLNQWTVLGNLEVADADAAEGLLFLQLGVHSGRLRAQQPIHGVVFIQYSDPMNGSNLMEFTGTVASVNAQLALIQYACFTLDGCEEITRDYLTIHVDDNGFTGTGGAKVSSQSATIRMRL